MLYCSYLPSSCPLSVRYLLKARRAYSRRQGARAVTHFVRALALARLVHGERHWRTLRCQVLLARAYLDLQVGYWHVARGTCCPVGT